MEAYEFLDVEAELVSLIKARVRVAASTILPKAKPTEHVLVIRVGGTANQLTDQPMVTFIASSDTWPKAAALGKLLRQRLMSVTRFGEHPVYRVREVGGLSRSPDPDTGDPRYQLTVEFKLRGSTPPE